MQSATIQVLVHAALGTGQSTTLERNIIDGPNYT